MVLMCCHNHEEACQRCCHDHKEVCCTEIPWCSTGCSIGCSTGCYHEETGSGCEEIESGHEERGSGYDGTAWEQEHYKKNIPIAIKGLDNFFGFGEGGGLRDTHNFLTGHTHFLLDHTQEDKNQGVGGGGYWTTGLITKALFCVYCGQQYSAAGVQQLSQALAV